MDLADAVTRLPADAEVALRTWTRDDVPAMVRACADPGVQRFTMVPDDYTEAQAEGFVAYTAAAIAEGASAELAAVAADDRSDVLGAVGLVRIDADLEQAEVGYWTAPHARRRGVATRAIRLISAWAFAELSLTRLQLMPFAENVASQHVAERAGYRREGLLRSFYRAKPGLVDVVMYARLRGDPE
jgi:RimJ/RimL family protein N-acetyltransferase